MRVQQSVPALPLVYKDLNMKSKSLVLVSLLLACVSVAQAADRPNIIIVYTDDISARELPIYGSSTWTPPQRGDTSDKQFLARTPVLNQMAQEGCWVKTAWASVVCSPSRAMMMTGRYAHRHKWWANSYRGRYIEESGKPAPWPFYKSCPQLMGHFAQQGGYATYWAGKTQVAGDLREYGFQQGCFTPGNLSDTDNPFADFKMVQQKVDGEMVVVNTDTNKPYDTYPQHGWYFHPHVRLMNHGGKDFQWWPNTPETIESFGVGTYGPDVELEYIFDFMDRQHEKKQPFLVYHTTHLGHGAFDWLNPKNGQCWPGTPVIKWDAKGYTRTEPNITGDNGQYDSHGTVTANGMHTHIEYLDYQMWQYRNKLQELGIADNTVVIFCSDNGTSGYGKSSVDRQKGVHVPLIIYAPGMTKHGEQDVLVNMSDMLPTVAELAGVSIPDDYEINGQSLVPFLYTDKPKHRDWIYGYKEGQQLIRGSKVMKDGFDRWWDVTADPGDLISFPKITNWDDVSHEHHTEREMLNEVLPRFDLFDTEPDAPGVNLPRPVNKNKRKSKNAKAKPVKSQGQVGSATKTSNAWETVFKDNYEGRTNIGPGYSTARGMEDAWVVTDGVLLGEQTNVDHGAVIRVDRDFDDVDIQFDFQFMGGKNFNLVIDDKNDKSVHAGHICRVTVSPKRLTISDDKTGGMNLKVRKQRKNKNLSTEDSIKLAKIMEETRSSVATKIQPNQWHNLRVRIKGDIMKAFLNGELKTSLKSPGFDHPTKTTLGFTVNGSKIGFDNFVIKVADSAKPNPPKQTQKTSEKTPVPTWTDAEAAAQENPSFQFLGEYTHDDTAIQVVPAEERFYLSIYQGGLPGAGWNGGQIQHEWIDADAIADRLVGFTKYDRAASLEFTKPPSDAIVLFDGTKNKHWEFATVTDGILQAGAATRENFTDFKLHFECMTPYKPSLPLSDPRRGNSGVFAVGAYEVQIIDTFALDLIPEAWKETKIIKKADTWCGSIYGIAPPLINVCSPPLAWQTFDVEFTAARFDAQSQTKTCDAEMTVHHNGVLVQDHVKLPSGTGGGLGGPRAEVGTGPIYFQKHGNPVQFRNIWIQVKQ